MVILPQYILHYSFWNLKSLQIGEFQKLLQIVVIALKFVKGKQSSHPADGIFIDILYDLQLCLDCVSKRKAIVNI